MRKLGFAIKVVSDGAYNALVCNNGTWLKKVIDPRHYLRMFSGLVGTENVVTAMSFSEFGCYVMLLRDIPGHAGDCLSAWLFIPCNIDIEDNQVVEAYQYAKSVLYQSSLKAVNNEANAFFDKEYPAKKISYTYSPSIGEKLGLRYVNNEGELFELLGKKRYQEYYSQFKAIFILDRNSEVKVNEEGALSFGGDLTKQQLEEYSVLMPPTDSVLSEMGQGAKVIFRTGRTFDSPISIKKGSRVEFFVRRDGFEDVVLKAITVDEDVMPFPPVGHLNWKKRINKAFFDIRNHDGEKVEVEKIVVAGYDITMQQVALPEDDCRCAKVQISAYRYEPYESTVDFLSLREKLKVTLHRAEGIANYSIILANGREADMTLKSKYFDEFGGSPLEGYSFDGRTLQASFGYKMKYWFYGFLTTIVLAILIIGYTAFDSYMDNHEFQFGWPPIVEKNVVPPSDDEFKEESSDSVEAITYLNDHEKWSKTAMDTLSVLPTGLYDCLKLYRFADLVNMSIDGCDQFNKIKEVAQKAIDNGVQMSGNYDDSPDSTITIKNWIKKVTNRVDKLSTKDDFTDVIDNPTTVNQPGEHGELANQVNKNKQERINKINSAKNKEKSTKVKTKAMPKSDSPKSSTPKQSDL